MKIKKFGEFNSPPEQIEESAMEPTIGAGVAEKQHNVELLQTFVKNYQDLNENLEKAEQVVALFEQFTKEKQELIRKQEVENILTTHLLIVNENIQDIRSTLSGINKKDLQIVQNAVQSIEEKANTVLEYVNLEVPKVKKSLVEAQFNQDANLRNFAQEFKEYGETVGNLTTYKEEVKEEVFGLALQVANNFQAANKTRAELEKQILSVYEDVRAVNINLESLTEDYTSKITPVVERLNNFEKVLFLIDESFTTALEKKQEISDSINEVGSLFINSKYEQLNNKIDRIEEIFTLLENKTVLNEETGVVDTVVTDVSTPENRMKATADAVGKYLNDKSFQQPDPEKVSADFTAVTAKLKFLEQAIGRIAATGPGGGEVNLRYLDDIDRSTIGDGLYLRYNATTKKFEFADPMLSYEDIDNPFNRITNGDYSAAIDNNGNVSMPANATVAGALLVGNAGDETEGIDVNGTTYKSSFIVTDIGGEDQAQAILHRHSTSQEPLIAGARSNTDDDTDADVTNGMSLLSMIGTGYVGSDYQLFGQVQISAADDGILSATNSPGKITLQVTEEGHNSDLYTAFSVTGKNVNILDRWDFNTDGTTSFPDDTLKTNAPLTVNVTAGDNAPATIILTGADWVDANGTYKRSYNVTPPTWIKEGSPTTIVYDSGWSVRNDGAFGAGVSIYVNTGTLESPDVQWNISPPLGSVPPTGIYKNAEWVFGVDSKLTAPGDIVPDTDNVYGLGTPTKQWKHLYVSNTTVYLDNIPLALKQSGTSNNYTISVGSGTNGNTQNDLATQDYVQSFQNIDGGSARAVYSANLINVDGGGA
jgi:hypothetical protein